MENNFHFPKGWFTAGHGELWSCDSTYCFVPYENLPILENKNFDGNFQWLIESAEEFEECLSQEEQNVLLANIDILNQLTKQINLCLPDSFLKFLSAPHLRNRIASCTDCYFNLSNRLIKLSEKDDGYLIRFLNDSQNVLLWYLYVKPNSESCIVFAKPKFLDELDDNFEYADEAENETLDDVIIPTEIYYCSPNFETFIYRFWIENSIWFSLIDKKRLSKEQQDYMNQRRI